MREEEVRAPFAEQTSKVDKRRAGRTDAGATPVEIRGADRDAVDAVLQAWIHRRLGRQLGKFALMIERVQVRFEDDNGNKGGVDKSCLIHVMLSKLPVVVVQAHGVTAREAFDVAAARVERATRRDMDRHGVHTHRGRRHVADGMGAPVDSTPLQAPEEQTTVVGRLRPSDLHALVARERAVRRTDLPGVSADDLKVGARHTAVRNAKQNTAGMVYQLEDSTTGKPSRKSTRGGTNRTKPGNPLTQRTQAAVRAPKRNAARAAAHGHPHASIR
ncbi:MAG TPA: HPF/RaiA family ribosome-associated protein [Polyangiales bacterium]